MANPTFKDGAIPRKKRPGAALLPQDAMTAIEAFGIHNETPPNLADGDVQQQQMDDMANIKVTLGDPTQVADLSDSKGAITNEDEGVTNSANPLTMTGNPNYLTIQNIGSKVIYIGGSGVTSSSYGIQLVPRQIYDFGKIGTGFTFYHICGGSDTSTLGLTKYA